MFFDMSIFYILQDEYKYIYIYTYVHMYIYTHMLHISKYIDLLELGTEKGGFTSNDLMLENSHGTLQF